MTSARDFQIARQLLDRAHVHQRMADEAVVRWAGETKSQKTVTVRRLAVVLKKTNALGEADQ